MPQEASPPELPPLDADQLEPEVSALLAYRAVGAQLEPARFIGLITALQHRVEPDATGPEWRRRPSALGTRIVRRHVLARVEALLLGAAPVWEAANNVVFGCVLLVYFCVLARREGALEVLECGVLQRVLLPAVLRAAGTYEPPDGVHAAARGCSIVGHVVRAAASEDAAADGAPGRAAVDPDFLTTAAHFVLRVFALYWDRPPSDRPPVPAEALFAINAVRDASERLGTHGVAGSPHGNIVATAAVHCLDTDVFSGGAAAVIGEVARNALVSSAAATWAAREGLLAPLVGAARVWAAHAGAQEQLLSAAYNTSCSLEARRVWGHRASDVVAAGRAAIAALTAHGTHEGAVVAALRLLDSPCSNGLGAMAAATRGLVEGGGCEAVAAAVGTFTARRAWHVVTRAVSLLGSWGANPHNAAHLPPVAYLSLVRVARACGRDAGGAVPDGVRVALAGALASYGRHTPNGLRVQRALAVMEGDGDDGDVGDDVGAGGGAAPQPPPSYGSSAAGAPD